MPIGIDPDLSGALAVLDAVGALVALCDTPVLHLPMARGRAPRPRPVTWRCSMTSAAAVRSCLGGPYSTTQTVRP